MEYEFSELNPKGLPGVTVDGWCIVEQEYGDWYVASVFVGERAGEHKALMGTDPLFLAIVKTLSHGSHADRIEDKLYLERM